MIVFHLARADNGVVGDRGAIPWRIPGEQRRFRDMTMGKPMIMGRRTFDSFPAPLPGRRHIVLTRDPAWTASGAEPVRSVDVALQLAGAGDAGGEVAVIGGAEIFALFLARADRIELTEVHAAPAGDAIVPPFVGWHEVARHDVAASASVPGYSFVTLVR